jgi:hypothetical protein
MTRYLSALALLVFLAFIAEHAYSTSCIQNKRFKTKQVCGVVVAPEGTPMPNVRVDLVDLNTKRPDTVETLQTDTEGRFSVADVTQGEYALRVRLSGLANASQNFVLKAHGRSSGCEKPIRVVMQVAGRCSTISVSHKK